MDEVPGRATLIRWYMRIGTLISRRGSCAGSLTLPATGERCVTVGLGAPTLAVEGTEQAAATAPATSIASARDRPASTPRVSCDSSHAMLGRVSNASLTRGSHVRYDLQMKARARAL